MASIFSPDSTRAGQDSPGNSRSGISSWTPRSTANTSSVDPHDGLPSLGQIEGLQQIIRVYDTPLGTRFTVIDRDSNETVGTLLTAEDVERFFPEIIIRGLRFDTIQREDGAVDSIGPLMLADPPCADQW